MWPKTHTLTSPEMNMKRNGQIPPPQKKTPVEKKNLCLGEPPIAQGVTRPGLGLRAPL